MCLRPFRGVLSVPNVFCQSVFRSFGHVLTPPCIISLWLFVDAGGFPVSPSCNVHGEGSKTRAVFQSR